MAASPQSISSSFRRSDEWPVVSGLGLSSDSEASGSGGAPDLVVEVESRPRGVPWVRPPPSKKTLWKRRVGLEVEPGAQPHALPARLFPPPRREVSPEMENKCFRCLLEGHYRKDCTNDIACFRCGLSGHGSRDGKRPRSPSAVEDLRRKAAAKAARREAERRGPALRPSGASSLPPPPPTAATSEAGSAVDAGLADTVRPPPGGAI